MIPHRPGSESVYSGFESVSKSGLPERRQQCGYAVGYCDNPTLQI